MSQSQQEGATQLKSVLIVEDEKPLREALHLKFQQAGYDTYLAGNGEEGLALALEKHPDCILLDIVMPVMDGMRMLEKLRFDTWGKDAVVILLTNLGEQERVAEALTHDAFDYMIKSDWKLEDVVAEVEKRLV